MPNEVCSGLTVLEIGTGSMAGSLAGMVLADFGARVIKVEPPDGDRLRLANHSGFTVWNRGKESLTLDLRTPDGQQDFLGLVASADIVIESFQPGTTESWGLGAEQLTAAHPHLVVARISAFGQHGDYAQIKGYEQLIAAKAGVYARGSFGPRPGANMYPQPSAGFGAGMEAVAGILAALIVREDTGRGQIVDATMLQGLDAIDYFMTIAYQLAVRAGRTDALDARSTATASRTGVLLCTKDGRFIQTSALLKHQALALCRALGLEALEAEARFANMPQFATPEEAQDWEDLLMERCREQDLGHWLPRFEGEGDIAFEVARTSEEGLDHPQVLHNGDTITIDDPDLGSVRQVGPIAHLSETPAVIRTSAPRLGEHAALPDGPRSEQPATDLTAAPPLDGITIVELGPFYAMPFATVIAASLGARVIKLEDAKGDPFRIQFGPEVGSTRTINGKESLSLDLKSDEGQHIARELIATADVFITGMRPGVAQRLGLGEAELRAGRPELIYINATGYGTDGPYARRALYAQAAQAVAGSFHRQVGYWSDPAQNIDMSVMELQAVVIPRLSQIVDGDSNAAMGVLTAVLLSLFHRRRTGNGQVVTCSMIAGNAWAYSDDFCTYEGKPPVPICDDDSRGTDALHRVYVAAEDTWVCLVVETDVEWQALASAMGLDGLDRSTGDAQLISALTPAFKAHTAAEWQALLVPLGVGCVEASMIGHAGTTVTDRVYRETGLTFEDEHPVYGTVMRAAPPLRFSSSSVVPGTLALRGQHNHPILTGLGYTADQIADLEHRSVVHAATTTTGSTT